MLRMLFQSVYGWLALIVLAVLITTSNSFLALTALSNLTDLEEDLENTNTIINAINDVHVGVLRVESGQRGFLLTQDADYLQDYTETLNDILPKLANLSSVRSVSDVQQERIADALKLSEKKLNEMIETVELSREGRMDDALALVNTEVGLAMYQQLEALFTEINLYEQNIQVGHRAQLNEVLTESKLTFAISAFMTTALILGLFLLIYKANREQQEHRDELERQNLELEEQVEKRTQVLKLYSEELSRSNRELEDFAFVASHDLQEPLRKIRAFGDRIKTGYADVLDERGQDFLGRMLNAAARMSTLISDLLEFSRVSTRGKEFAPTDLNRVLETVLEDVELRIAEKNATVNVGDLPTIDADKSQMEQVFLNLMTNSLKFQKPDVAPTINIYVSELTQEEIESRQLDTEKKFIDIHFEDNGIGFEQSYADKIFVPFQRLHGRSDYAGTGIGLAVCRRIIERHNGTINVISSLGNGAKFIITLPTKGVPFGQKTSFLGGAPIE
ncbi:sensor histidine kinase [Alteromonas oceanisediminis]|uniref:sensor histidine kinase n=1 Tax=Alteromonas oceanisediminis TaxID=2836180 RepID=UPI001BD929A0|nr:sensor histidine kinase [Alteromonas oceanisediminis]MBT0586700.1 CHASE3 domain-containing protein [Alteromonas oceanisediminis]